MSNSLNNHNTILLFGATGFVGSSIVNQLVKDGFNPILITRSQQKSSTTTIQITGSLDAPHEIVEQTKKYSPKTMIYLIGIIKERKDMNITFNKMHYEWFVAACQVAQKLNIKRVILMSANNANPNGTEYQKTKYSAEQYLRHSQFDWTIFRPSVIFDFDNNYFHFLRILYGQLRLPIVPIIGDGKYLLTPVARKDIARIFSKAINTKFTYKNTYEIGGPKNYTYQNLLEILSHTIGLKKYYLHVPIFFIKIAIFLFGRFSFFPITYPQLQMLLEGNMVKDKSIWKELQLKPENIESILMQYK